MRETTRTDPNTTASITISISPTTGDTARFRPENRSHASRIMSAFSPIKYKNLRVERVSGRFYAGNVLSKSGSIESNVD